MKRRTVVVEGPLAFQMRRAAAASAGETGLQIYALAQMAGRLAGGFRRAAQILDLEPAIKAALNEGGFREFESLRRLPGMTRAVASTLGKIWNADIVLEQEASRHPRLGDLALIEARVRALLPEGVMTVQDLRDAALARVEHAAAVLGPIAFERVARIRPLWRPLVVALHKVVDVQWHGPATHDVGWFPGHISAATSGTAAVDVVSCADPQAEAVEALRWARDLLASGRARPEEIAICAPATDEWDDHILVLARSADLPVHFSHGLAGLATREGQACAALADILLRGLAQDRVRRLLGYAVGRAKAAKDLPTTWALGLPAEAGLFEIAHWRRALDVAAVSQQIDPRQHLLPILELLSKGIDGALAAGQALLEPAAQALWAEALRRAPADAIEFALAELRVPDERDPSAAIVWCPASHALGAPRKWTRLLGLTSRSWPRRAGEDPLLPDHILPRATLDPEPVTVQDRRAFDLLVQTSSVCVLSRSRRNAQGNLLAPSALVPHPGRTLKRGRIPEHAFSESDRLLARPHEARKMPRIAAATQCWTNWHAAKATAHDGLVRADHPLVAAALAQVQSATSLRLLVRDPLAFAWRYALGWRSTAEDDQPLGLGPRAYGELVHELLKRTIDILEPDPGYGGAALHEIEAALTQASEAIVAQWPLERSVPPLLLWRHIVDGARTLALRALTFDKESFQPTTRSWTEVAFGEPVAAGAHDLPWTAAGPVRIPDCNISVRGSIDRFDLNANGDVRLSDYKTGREPQNSERAMLRGGNELQRTIYALTVRQLRPEATRIVSRFLFLGEDKPRARPLRDVDEAIGTLSVLVGAAARTLLAGTALPGPDAGEETNDFRLALPAAATYLLRKRTAFADIFGDHVRVWRAP